MRKTQNAPVWGGIYFVRREPERPKGHEQWSQRPGIVVSDVRRNTCMVVYLTTGEALPDPDDLHVKITSATKPSLALCDQIKTVDVRFLGQCFGHVTEDEGKKIAAACRRALQSPDAEEDEEEHLNAYEVEERRKAWRVDETNKEIDGLIAELTKARADADAWQRVALHLMER